MAKESWENDGPRYVASLQDVTDKQCYKDFFEGDKFEEAKQKAEDAAEKYQRSSLVYDRKLMAITHKKVIELKKIEEKPAPPPRRGRGRKKVETDESKKKVSKDDYFE